MKLTKEFFNDYYYNRKLSFKKIAEITNFSVGTLHRNFKKLNLVAIKQNKAWNSEKTCYDDSRILSGTKHPRWKNKSKYLIDFKLKRKEIINDKTKCSHCDKIAQVLHHKDKNTRNNDYKNLLPLCKSCHTVLHNKERGITIYKHNCKWCGKEFIVLSIKNCKRKFCSQSCSSSYKYYIEKTTLPKNNTGKTYYKKKCKYCKKQFTTFRPKQQFCSYSCASSLKSH